MPWRVQSSPWLFKFKGFYSQFLPGWRWFTAKVAHVTLPMVQLGGKVNKLPVGNTILRVLVGSTPCERSRYLKETRPMPVACRQAYPSPKNGACLSPTSSHAAWHPAQRNEWTLLPHHTQHPELGHSTWCQCLQGSHSLLRHNQGCNPALALPRQEKGSIQTRHELFQAGTISVLSLPPTTGRAHNLGAFEAARGRGQAQGPGTDPPPRPEAGPGTPPRPGPLSLPPPGQGSAWPAARCSAGSPEVTACPRPPKPSPSGGSCPAPNNADIPPSRYRHAFAGRSGAGAAARPGARPPPGRERTCSCSCRSAGSLAAGPGTAAAPGPG